MTSSAAGPIPYDPSFEHLEKDEGETAVGLIETMHGISEKTYADTGHGLRSVHAKSHALLRGQLSVLPGLPPELAQGLFAQAGDYPVVMRLSTTPGDVLDDAVSTPRGLALKIIGVPGERLPGSEGDNTQDFVLVNGPAFQVPHAKMFLQNLKLLAATTDKAEGAKKALSAALRVLEGVIESAGSQSGTVKSLGGQPLVHPLGETFYSQVPVLYGRYVAKISVAPVSPALTALTDQSVELRGRPNALRDEITAFFAAQGGEWELRVQLCTDPKEMPIENPAKIWDEKLSPYLPVARIRVAPQVAWSAEKSRAIDDGLAFSPWHGVTAHRPLGAIMRVRKATYEMSAHFRGDRNGCPLHEPRSVDDIDANAEPFVSAARLDEQQARSKGADA